MTSPVAHPSAPVRRPMHLQAIALAMVMMCVITLTLSRRPSQSLAAEGLPPERVVPSSDEAPVPQPATPTTAGVATAPVVASRAAGGESSGKAPVLKPEKNRIAESAAPAAAVTPAAEALGTEDATSTRVESESVGAEPAPASPAPAAAGAVTITGCLEGSANEDRFRLTDTEGGDALRSRSWRTGFLKKHSSPVALVEPPDPGALRTQVGQRVAATGLLTSRALRVHSVRVIGPRCN